jgi:hypothetical protein
MSGNPPAAINPYQSPREPAPSRAGPLVFTSFVRRCQLAAIVGPLVLLSLGGPAVGTAAAYSVAGDSGPLLWLASLAGAAVGIAAVMGWLNVANSWTHRRLAHRLARIWRDAGIDVHALGGRFVELGARAEPRVYHGGMTNWDVGFLILTRERLVYLGDLATFSVPREQIEQVHRGPTSIERMTPEALYVSWRPPMGDEREGFSLGTATGSLVARQSDLIRLNEEIDTWLDSPIAQGTDLPPNFPTPPLPELASVPSKSLWAHLLFSIGAGVVALSIGLGLLGTDVAQRLQGQMWVAPSLAALLGGSALGLGFLTTAMLSPAGVRAALASRK